MGFFWGGGGGGGECGDPGHWRYLQAAFRAVVRHDTFVRGVDHGTDERVEVFMLHILDLKISQLHVIFMLLLAFVPISCPLWVYSRLDC